MTASDFSKKSRFEIYEGYHINFAKKVITCTNNNTLRELFELLINNSIHQIYLVNKENQAIGVISFLDIIRGLC